MHVYPPPIAHGEVVARRQPNGFEEELWKMLRQYQAPAEAVAVTHRLEEGQPAEEIIRSAREGGCGLIIMGTHGRTGLRRLLMGSVAEQVVRGAPCPVLTVSIPEVPDETVQPAGAANP